MCGMKRAWGHRLQFESALPCSTATRNRPPPTRASRHKRSLAAPTGHEPSGGQSRAPAARQQGSTSSGLLAGRIADGVEHTLVTSCVLAYPRPERRASHLWAHDGDGGAPRKLNALSPGHDCRWPAKRGLYQRLLQQLACSSSAAGPNDVVRLLHSLLLFKHPAMPGHPAVACSCSQGHSHSPASSFALVRPCL